MKHIVLGAIGIGLGILGALGFLYRFDIYPFAREVQISNPEEEVQTARLVFAGDIMLSRSVGALMQQKNDFRWPFLNIGEYIEKADLAFANLENPVSTRGTRVGSIYSFRADPRSLEGLSFAGFDVVSVANNHMWDYGRIAFLDTLTHLREAGITPVGGGETEQEARNGIVKEVKGIKIGFLAYTNLLPQSAFASEDKEGVAFLNLEEVKGDIALMQPNVDILIVSYHLGDEYQTTHNRTQEQIYRATIDAGADLVIGHHPHVTQEVEPYQKGWIAYSLGNFIFDQNFSQETMTGLVLEAEVDKEGVKNIKEVLIDISREYQASLREPESSTAE